MSNTGLSLVEGLEMSLLSLQEKFKDKTMHTKHLSSVPPTPNAGNLQKLK